MAKFSDPFKNGGCFFRAFGQLTYLCIAAVSCCKTFDPPLKLELNPFLGREPIKKVVLPSQLSACFSPRQLMALLSAVLCSTGHSFFLVGLPPRSGPPCGSCGWASPRGPCAFSSLLFTGRLAGWGPPNNKALTLNFPLSVGIWLWACVEHASEWLERESWVCWGWGGALLSGEMRRKNLRWVFVPLWWAGGQSQGRIHGRRTAGFAAAWPPALYLVPKQLPPH